MEFVGMMPPQDWTPGDWTPEDWKWFGVLPFGDCNPAVSGEKNRLESGWDGSWLDCMEFVLAMAWKICLQETTGGT